MVMIKEERWIATLYGAIGHAWGIPYTNAVVVTITAIDTFIGTILGISTSNYNKNTVSNVDIEEDQT
jgi:hypothetical protein